MSINVTKKGNVLSVSLNEKQEDDELWDEAIEKILDWNYNIPDYSNKTIFIKELQKHYTITKK